MRFYHVSRDVDPIEMFIPRVPQSRTRIENDTIPRICVSSTIEGCFTGIAGGCYQFETLFTERKGIFRLYEIDTTGLQLSDESIISSKELFEKGYVHDAFISDEHWILKPIKNVRSMLIRVIEYKKEEVIIDYTEKGEKQSGTTFEFSDIEYVNIEKIYRRVFPE